MNENSDAQLLRQFAEHGRDDAFREIVTRHADFVYSAALRQVESPDLAADLSQNVFVNLARKARQLELPDNASLAGWLHRSTRYAALNHWRDTQRRRTNERLAMEQLLTDSEPAVNWEQIRPALDEALDALSDDDREALLLRYFKNLDFRAVGLALGVSDDTAQKRVSRALERLREFFSKRNVTIGASGLAVLISANAVQSAPLGLATTISAAAVLTGTVVSTSTIITAAKTIAMTTFQKTLITVAFVAITGAGIFEAHQATQLRAQNQTLQQQQAPLASDLTKLQTENERLSNLVAEAKDQKALTQAQFNELLKLRGQTGQARTAVQELAKLKIAAAQQNRTIPAFYTNAMAQGVAISEQYRKKAAIEKLARMKEKLNLTDAQAQAINNIMLNDITNSSQQTLNAMLHQQKLPAHFEDEEADIKALLTPDQLAAYPDYQQSESMFSANSEAKSDLSLMSQEMDLSQEQQDKARSALYQLDLNQISAPPNQKAITQARAGGDIEEAMNLQVETQKQTLADKLKALDGILTPEQLQVYQQKELDKVEMLANASKMFLPKTINGATQ